MERNIVISINAEIVLKATKEEEKIIKAIENSTSDDKYDELQDKLNQKEDTINANEQMQHQKTE